MDDRVPIAVGGVGGSGTRVVAAILEEAGVWMGGDLNESRDNLWFTLLFKHPGILSAPEPRFGQLVSLFLAAMSGTSNLTATDVSLLNELVHDGRPQHDAAWLELRAQSLRLAIADGRRASMWGWKEPNTHMIVEKLPLHIPRIKYIHVARSGLDMAFSANQNQLKLWGPAVLAGDHAATPRNSLRFWCWAHERILKIGQDLGERFLFIRFEELCQNPRKYVPLILSFAGTPATQELVDRTVRLVEPPASIGRFADRQLTEFDPEDVAYVRRLGFAA
jgi:hypothetical protein